MFAERTVSARASKVEREELHQNPSLQERTANNENLIIYGGERV